MKRASLNAVPTAGPAAAAGDLTDRLLNRETTPKKPAGRPTTPTARPAAGAARARSPRPENPQLTGGDTAVEPGALGPALQAAQEAVAALQRAARAEPARYEVALRFRLDALAHHVQQVQEYMAARLSR